jgi:ADP-ribose pyrophosphatase YjhB (NUDIX family)
MVDLSVGIAIIHDGQILLTKREDFEVWCLPGGAVDPNESLAQAAIREAEEETGLIVELTRLIGIYSLPNWQKNGSHNVLFAARPIGGALRLCPGETVDVQYFAFDRLPVDLMPSHQQKVRDAAQGIGGSAAWRQDLLSPLPPEMDRQALYAARDQSGLSRSDYFWQQLMRNDRTILERCEVSGHRVDDATHD